MKDQIIIKTENDLIRLAEKDIISVTQFRKVIENCTPFVGLLMGEFSRTSEVVPILKEHLSKPREERGIFIGDIDIDVIK